MKKVGRWLVVFLVIFGILTPVVFSITSANDAFAEPDLGTEDLNTIKQNALYKVIYKNLAKCYVSMQGSIDESMDSVWANFNSNTYFSSNALASDFLKFPYGVGSQNQSSCPNMITGWKTNWFVNLFTGTGNYNGLLSINANAEVPDNTWYERSVTKMGNFLKNIGYEVTSQEDGDLSNRSCFYLRFKLNQSTYDNWWLPTPAKGTDFETVDFCVKLNNDGTVQQTSDAIISLSGHNEYFGEDDNGHLTDESNIAFVYFGGGLEPWFGTGKYGDMSGKKYLQANMDQVDLRYPYNDFNGYNSLYAGSIATQHINDKEGTHCSELGYTNCGWEGFVLAPSYIGSLMEFDGSITYSQLKTRMAGLLEKAKDSEGYDLFSSVRAIDYTPLDRNYKKSSDNAKFLKYFLGDTSKYNGGAFTDAEKYMLYYTYLKDNYGVATSSTKVGDNSVLVSWLNEADGSFAKTYIYDPDENLNVKQYVLSSDNSWDAYGNKTANWHEIAEMLAAIDVKDAFADANLTDSILDEDLNPGGTTGQPDSTGEATCGNSGGAMSLGWIVCPLLDWMGTASNTLYTGAVEPALQVKATLLDPNDSGSSTQEAWRVFQNLANIIFIILFLVVIFSQLTGVGIDNYGIKRILPKMVVVAILINLSYYICMIAVDVSNIVGSGIQALFNGIDIDVPTELSVTVGSDTGKAGEFAATAITGVAILGALAGMVGAIWANPAVVLSLLVGALGVIIAICFLFILLSARQAAIIVLVVISPVAIACYMLPNTKKLFDRWLQMGKGLLLVYPIAGALVGGGNFVSKLLLSSGFATGGFFEALTAMIVGIIPIFFIPSVLKSSFAAMGNLGAKISGAGDRFKGWSDRKIRNSEGYKDAGARWRAGMNRNGDMTTIGKLRAKTGQSNFAKHGIGRAMFGGVAVSQARGMAAVDKISGEDEAAGAKLMGAMATEGIVKTEALEGGALGSGFDAKSEGAYYGKQFLEAAERGDVSGMNAAIEAMRNSNMKPKDISKLLRYAQNNNKFRNGHGGAMDANARAAWYRDISKRYGNDFLATDFELQNFARMGGEANGGNLGDYGAFASATRSDGSRFIGMDDIKPQDVGKMSGDSIAGLVSAGLINQAMAQRAIAENSNLSVDKKMLLGAVASGISVGSTQADVKATMDKLMQDSNFAGGASIQIGGQMVTADMRQQWASATPQDVNIAQVGGQVQQDNVLNVRNQGGGNPPSPTPPAIP